MFICEMLDTEHWSTCVTGSDSNLSTVATSWLLYLIQTVEANPLIVRGFLHCNIVGAQLKRELFLL